MQKIERHSKVAKCMHERKAAFFLFMGSNLLETAARTWGHNLALLSLNMLLELLLMLLPKPLAASSCFSSDIVPYAVCSSESSRQDCCPDSFLINIVVVIVFNVRAWGDITRLAYPLVV